MRLKVVTHFTIQDSIYSAAILSDDGFIIEKAGDSFNYDSINQFIEIENNSDMITIIAEEKTIIARKIGAEILCLVCGISANLGKIRKMIDEAIHDISKLQ